MHLLANATAIEKALRGLLTEADRIRWAVAWATTSSPLFGALTENRRKILQLTVGTQFNQTDPDFIEEFRNDSNARFVFDSSGVFHPKVYFFGVNGGWKAVVGSANFTGAGLSTNNETAVLVSHNDVGSKEFLDGLQTTLASFHEMGVSVTPEVLQQYRRHFESSDHQDALNLLRGRQAEPLLERDLTIQESWFTERGGGHGITLGVAFNEVLGSKKGSPQVAYTVFHGEKLLRSGSLNHRNSARLTGTTSLIQALGLTRRDVGAEVTVRVFRDAAGVRLEFRRKV